MVDNVENSGKEGCCGSGCKCGGKRCCSGKAALALVLLLIGGLIGYGVGKCHGKRCGMMSGDCPMTATHTPTPASPAGK